MSRKRREEEQRRKENERKQRNKLLIKAAAIVCVCVGVFAAIYFAGQPIIIKASLNEAGDLVVPVDKISDEVAYIRYGGSQDIIARFDEAGQIKVAFNTCEECFATGNATYSSNGTVLVCNNCGSSFPLSVLGQAAWGGCQPVAIPAVYRQDNAGQLVIPAAVLQYSEEMFFAWDNEDYSLSLEFYQNDKE